MRRSRDAKRLLHRGTEFESASPTTFFSSARTKSVSQLPLGPFPFFFYPTLSNSPRLSASPASPPPPQQAKMFKSKGGAGPSGAVTSADAGGGYASGGATPTAAAAPSTPTVKTETRSRCCCCSVARGFLLALLSLLLLGALGSSVASLAIGPNQGLTPPEPPSSSTELR